MDLELAANLAGLDGVAFHAWGLLGIRHLVDVHRTALVGFGAAGRSVDALGFDIGAGLVHHDRRASTVVRQMIGQVFERIHGARVFGASLGC